MLLHHPFRKQYCCASRYGDTVHNLFQKEKQDLAAERHLPLAVLLPPTGMAPSALAQLAENEQTTIGMTDLHATVCVHLHAVDHPRAQFPF